MKYVHYFFATIFFAVGVIFSTIFCLIPANIMGLLGFKKTYHKIYWAWASPLTSYALWLLNYRVHVSGKENLPKVNSNICYISNHQSILDVCAYSSKLKLHASPVAKIEVLKAPYVSSYAKGVGAILLDRKSPRSSINAILNGTEELKQGKSVIIFPEGTRSKNGKLGEMKAGSFKMAIRAESTIVPLVIQGTRNGLETKKGLHKYHVYINVLPPTSAKNLSKEEQKVLPGKIAQQIKEAYENLPVPKL